MHGILGDRMSYRSLLWLLRSAQRRHFTRQPICSQWVTFFVRRSFASDSGGRKPFQSLLDDKNVKNPFEDPSRSRKERSFRTASVQQDNVKDKSEKSGGKGLLSELDDVKKMADDLLRKAAETEKQTQTSVFESKSSAQLDKDLKSTEEFVDFDSSMRRTSSLGGSSSREKGAAKVGVWKKVSKKLGTEIDENATEAEKKRQKMARNTKIGSVIMLATCTAGFVAFCLYYGRPKRDASGNYVKDEFSGSLLSPLYRIAKSFREWRDYVTEPSRELLLPDPMPPQFQPKYTLVMEMKHVLISPEWTYKTGHRFVKRPALDYFLDIVGYPNFEVVIYTSEGAMTAPQVIDSFDPKQRVLFRLFRDCTKYMKGHHVKDLSRLNRDLSKVIYIDYDPQSFQLNPDNVLRLPKWEGDMDDTGLVDLAELLKTIYLSNVEDVRPTLQYYSQFDDPLKEFRQRALALAEQERVQKERQAEGDNSVLKRYSGRLFGYRRHA